MIDRILGITLLILLGADIAVCNKMGKQNKKEKEKEKKAVKKK